MPALLEGDGPYSEEGDLFVAGMFCRGCEMIARRELLEEVGDVLLCEECAALPGTPGGRPLVE